MFVDDGGVEATLLARLEHRSIRGGTGQPARGLRHALRARWPNAAIATDTGVAPAAHGEGFDRDRRDAAPPRAALRVPAGLPRFGPGRRQRDVEAAVVEACETRDGHPSGLGPTDRPPRSTPFSSFLDLTISIAR